MKITDLKVISFRCNTYNQGDSMGHNHPGPEAPGSQSMYILETDEGICGYSVGENYSTPRKGYEDQLAALGRTGAPRKEHPASAALGQVGGFIEKRLKPLLVGEDPFKREKISNILTKLQRSNGNAIMSESVMSQIDKTLWDLFGRAVNMPLYQILGGHREKVTAYASTMVGDHFKGGLSTPEEYATYCKDLLKEGYRAIKLHTWADEDWSGDNPFGKPNVDKDIECCKAVREAVGPDVELMLDCFHYYDRYDAYKLGKAIQDLGYIWYEEPMDEYNVSSYKWLHDRLEIPIIGPEVAKGKHFTRAEWVINGVCDIARVGAGDVGGITPMLKTMHFCESLGIPLEIHSPGTAALHTMSVMTVPGKYYERGLLHPFLDYNTCPPWLKQPIDPLDSEGYVPVPKLPGLGYDINWDYINENLIK